MRLIHRYILLELVKTFILAVAAITLALFLERFLYMTPVLSTPGIRLAQIAKLAFFISPAFFEFAFPIGAFVAGLVVFHRLTADQEMAAMHASGWSFPFLLRPVWFFAAGVFLLTTLDILVALPWGNQSLQGEVWKIIQSRGALHLKPGVFYRDFEGMTLLFHERNENGALKNLFVSQGSGTEHDRVFLASEGQLVIETQPPRIELQMKNGKMHRLDSNQNKYERVQFRSYNLNLKWPDLAQVMKEWENQQGVIGNREDSIPQLMKIIREREARGEPAYFEEVVLSRKFSLIFSCLLFALLGPPLGLQSGKAGRYGALIAGALILLFYFLMLLFLQDMAYKNVIPTWPAPWWPNLFLTFILFFAMRHTLLDRSLWVNRS